MAGERQPLGFDPRPKPELSDRELVDQARTNHPEAFVELSERYSRKVFSFHYARLRSMEDAEDATQETFLSALTHLSDFRFERGEISFAAWIFSIANNYDKNEHRKRNRHPDTPLNDILESQLQSPFGNPETETEKNEEIKALMEAVQKLPYDQRNLIYLKFYAGLSNDEISKVLKRTEGATKALLHRTLRKLKKELSGEDVIDDERTPKETRMEKIERAKERFAEIFATWRQNNTDFNWSKLARLARIGVDAAKKYAMEILTAETQKPKTAQEEHIIFLNNPDTPSDEKP